MAASQTSPANKNAASDIVVDLYPFLRKYKNGHVARFLSSTFVPASEDQRASRGVATRDVVIDQGTGVSARLFLPSAAAATGRRLPLVLYVHGGFFCMESAFCRTYHRYAASLAARAGAVVVSVEYRLAPEHPIPAAYDDAWAALQWAASASDPWIAEHADPRRTFLAGDSAGGNIVYHTAVRTSRNDDNAVDVEGLIIVHPYFWEAERLPSETVWDGANVFPPYGVDRLWPFVTAGQAGNDDLRINPLEEEIASLKCRRALVAVAGKDTLRDRGCLLATRMRDCASIGADNVTLVESMGEDHGFHLYSPLRGTSKKLMQSIAQFINQPTPSPPPPPPPPPSPAPIAATHPELHACEGETSSDDMECWDRPIFGVPTTPFVDVFGYGAEMRKWNGPASLMAYGSLKIGRGKVPKTSFGLFSGRVRPNKANKFLSGTAIPASSVTKIFF